MLFTLTEHPLFVSNEIENVKTEYQKKYVDHRYVTCSMLGR